MDDRDRIGAAYLSHLTQADLRELAHADEVSVTEAQGRIQALHRAPGLLLDILDRPTVSAGLLRLTAPDASQRVTLISPFLAFAAAIHRIAADLRTTGYSPERTAPRQRVPVFDGPQLAAYLEEPAHRLFLAELLASFARSSTGVVIMQTPHGPHRRRWNDLDLSRLAMLLGALPEPERPPVWRRLGDLALFLTGVFPAALERALAGRLDPVRLAKSTGLAEPPSAGLGPAELFEWLGAGWYRLAASRTSGAAAATLAETVLGPGNLAAGDQQQRAPAQRERRDGPADTWHGNSQSDQPEPGWASVGSAMSDPAAAAALLRDSAAHFHQARRVLNAAADRYLFPVSVDWFTPPGLG